MILLLAPASAIRLPVVRRRDAVALGAAAGLHSQRAASAAESGSPAARLEELKTLGARAEQSQAKQTPAFWPGRLEGQPPPTPRVVLKDAPPIVILPGFGNDQVDYIAPNGLPEEVGLRAALTRLLSDAVPQAVSRTCVAHWATAAPKAGDLGEWGLAQIAPQVQSFEDADHALRRALPDAARNEDARRENPDAHRTRAKETPTRAA